MTSYKVMTFQLQECNKARGTSSRFVSLQDDTDETARALVDDALKRLAELEARIRSLTRRQFIQRNVCLKCGRLVYDTRTRIASVDGAPVALTRKETGVLEYLMLHEGRPVSQEELIEHVWDGSVDSFSNSIRVHISALRRKLRAALGYDPVVNRVGEGYVIGGDDK